MKYLILLPLFIFFSCALTKDQKFNRDQEQLHTKLTQMFDLDQKIRHQANDLDYKYDTIIYGKNKHIKDYTSQRARSIQFHSRVKLVKLYLQYKKKGKNIDSIILDKEVLHPSKLQEYFKKTDSIYTFIDKIDDINKLKIFKIVRKYGYPSNKRFHKKCDFSTVYFFLHILKPTDTKMLKILEKEVQKKRLEKYDYDRIINRIKNI